VKCRAGEYEESIKRCHESIEAAPDWPAKALNYPILAIAQGKLGQVAESRRALGLLTSVISDWTQQMYQFGPDYWVTSLGATGYWPVSVWDWLECQLYGHEAQRLLGIESVDDPRLHMLRARAFAGLRRSAKADVEYSIALKLSPDDNQVQLETHRNRAYVHVSQGEFVRAATEFAKASALAPDDSDLWRFQALAHLGAGDFDAYRQVCRGMVARFQDTQDAAVAYDVIDACVLRDESLDDMSQLIPLAEVGSAWYVGAIRVLGAANYRAGRFSEAVRCYQDASNVTRLRARDWEFLAMAHERLGQVAEAHQCLAEAIQWIDEANRQELDDLTGVSPVWEGWHEAIDVPMLLTEVKALLGRDNLKTPPSR
jgi:tetratricopeptide (TPR) repeat protein